jgi:hypothetical protein
MFVAGANGDLMLCCGIDPRSGGSGKIWAIHQPILQEDLYTGLVYKEVLHLINTSHVCLAFPSDGRSPERESW